MKIQGTAVVCAFLVTSKHQSLLLSMLFFFSFFDFYTNKAQRNLIPCALVKRSFLSRYAPHHTPLSPVSRGKTSWSFCRSGRPSELRKRLGLY